MIKKYLSIDSKLKYFFYWALMYIVIIVIGMGITIVATYYNNKHMKDIAFYDYTYYLKHGEFNPNVKVNRAHNLIYVPTENSCILYPEFSELDFSKRQLNSYYEKATSNNGYYGVRFNLLAEHKFAIVVAFASEEKMFLFYREPPFVAKTIAIICFMFGFVLIMMSTYIYLLKKMARQTQKMQRDYVDNITHELKSPITSVKALTETMYDGLIQDEEKRKRYYKIIMNEMTGLENTVSNMLELSKIQNDQIDCSKTTLSTYDVFGDIIEKYAALCDDNKMDFSITPNISAHTYVYTNKSLASRIMDILLDNAFKFADRKQGAIRIMFEDDGLLLTITIANNGIGIAPEDQTQIFSRFYKGDKSHNEKGSGLGLAIASEIANCLGEKLWLSSTGSDRTAFSFTIHKK